MPELSPSLARELHALARNQSDVVRRTQLLELGVTRHHIRDQLLARRWQMIATMVVVLHNGPLTRAQSWWAAVLHAGPRSLLAGLTALEAGGLSGWWREEVHVVVPFGVRVPRLRGLVVHTSRVMDAGVPSRGRLLPPSTSVARAALDGARWAESPRRAAGLVHAVVQQRLVSPVALARCLDELGPVPHRGAIVAAIHDAAGGADSLAEADVARLVRRAGLPEPRRQVVVSTPEGLRRVDLVVDLPDGRLLVIEVDGVHHDTLGVRREDVAKDAAIIAAGNLVLRLPVAVLRLERATVLRQLVTIRESAERRAHVSTC